MKHGTPRHHRIKKLKERIKYFSVDCPNGIHCGELDLEDYIVCVYEDGDICIYEYQGYEFMNVTGLTEKEEEEIEEYYDSL